MQAAPKKQSSANLASKIFWGFLLCLALVLGGVVIWMPTDTQQTIASSPAPVKKPVLQNTAPVKLPATAPASSTPATKPAPTSEIFLNVPFISQAPLGNWADQRQEAGCEEAAALMAMLWVQGKESIAAVDAESQIIAISDWEQKNYGEYRDTKAQDTIDRIFKGYFGYSNVELKEDVSVNDIKAELANGNLVIVPADGRKLHNPNYVPPGPIEHNIVIRGYDPATKEFITNDPGTRRGKEYRYKENVLYDALQDYPTGNHEIILSVDKVMIAVRRAA